MHPLSKRKLLREFERLYPDPKSELVFKGNFQLLITVMLSAQCTDKKVNEVSPVLFEYYPTIKTLADAKVEDIEILIRPINYYKTKARHLVATAQRLRDHYNGRIPKTHKDLITLPGVGQKTANVVMSERGIAPAFPVDTHVFRVAKRLGLGSAATREKVEEELKLAFAPEHWRNLHHWLIFHGRRVCKAQRPLCGECTLQKQCAHFQSEEK